MKKISQKKVALITGITGQDGSYLAEFLLSKNYTVHGIKRRASEFNTHRIDHIFEGQDKDKQQLWLHHGDMTDSLNLSSLIGQIKPDEIYNLAAQSHVAVSFEMPEYTANVDALGTLRILEAVRQHGLMHSCRIYQASTSELYGLIQETPQNEGTPFYPRSPYAVAKLYAYWITINYREAYGMYACNGILFNHESPRRGETFVTRKITRQLSRLAYGMEREIRLGNLDSKRDWGHARDFVEMQWLMLQQRYPKDYVIATGQQYTVRQFLDICASEIGIEIRWIGSGVGEVGVVKSKSPSCEWAFEVGQQIVRVDEHYFRPTEVESLLGDPSLAASDLNWKPKTTVHQMVKEMMLHDMKLAKADRLATLSKL